MLKSSWTIVSTPLLLILCVAAGVNAQSPAPATAAPALKPYTASDQSAQAGVPPGWQVTKGAETVIMMSGPNGENISLGQTFVARNAPFQASQPPANGIDVSIPNSASLAEKFTDLLEFAAAQSHGAAPNVKIASSGPLQVPSPLQCGSVAGTYTGPKGLVAFGALICSLPVDVGGTYKIMFKLAQAPPNIAAQEKALAGAVFASYRIPQAMLQKKLAPHFLPPPPAPSVPGGGVSPMMPSPNDPVQNGCFDLVVIRETPDWQLPAKCRQ